MKDPEDEAFEELSLKQGQWEHTSGWRKKQILETSMTQEALKQMYQLLLTEPHAPTVCAQLERIAREALAFSPQRKPLTDEQIFACENSIPDEVVSDRDWCIYFARAIEAAHGIKENT